MRASVTFPPCEPSGAQYATVCAVRTSPIEQVREHRKLQDGLLAKKGKLQRKRQTRQEKAEKARAPRNQLGVSSKFNQETSSPRGTRNRADEGCRHPRGRRPKRGKDLQEDNLLHRPFGCPETRRGPQGRSPLRAPLGAYRKAPSASATPCPPAASRCSTLGEGGLNCRVRDGTG